MSDKKITELEAKLAIAVKALNNISGQALWRDEDEWKTVETMADEALAKIKEVKKRCQAKDIEQMTDDEILDRVERIERRYPPRAADISWLIKLVKYLMAAFRVVAG